MSNKSSVSGKYLSRVFSAFSARCEIGDDKSVRYDDMILRKQRKTAMRKRKQERQNKRKARR